MLVTILFFDQGNNLQKLDIREKSTIFEIEPPNFFCKLPIPKNPSIPNLKWKQLLFRCLFLSQNLALGDLVNLCKGLVNLSAPWNNREPEHPFWSYYISKSLEFSHLQDGCDVFVIYESLIMKIFKLKEWFFVEYPVFKKNTTGWFDNFTQLKSANSASSFCRIIRVLDNCVSM